MCSTHWVVHSVLHTREPPVQGRHLIKLFKNIQKSKLPNLMNGASFAIDGQCGALLLDVHMNHEQWYIVHNEKTF